MFINDIMIAFIHPVEVYGRPTLYQTNKLISLPVKTFRDAEPESIVVLAEPPAELEM